MARRRTLLSELQNQFPTTTKKELHALVLCGDITVNGELVRDPKQLVPVGASLQRKAPAFVSRGGRKLEAALRALAFPVAGRVFLDAGASTGGFTDCLLRHGAAEAGRVFLDAGASTGGFTDCLLRHGAAVVHAVDSGHNQLDFRLRQDPRVIVQEDTPVQEVENLDPRPDAAVCDISFRSIRDIAAHILGLTKDRSGILLVKPQFEWLHPAADFDGVVARTDDLRSILQEVFFDLFQRGIQLCAGVESPVTGHRGNREFLLVARLDRDNGATPRQDLAAAAADSLVDYHEWTALR